MLGYRGRMGKGSGKRQKLQSVPVGLEEAQLTHLAVLMRVTHKSRSRLIRDAIDYYFANFRVGSGTLGEAEARYLRSTGSTTGVSRRRDRAGGLDPALSRELPERRSGSDEVDDKPRSNFAPVPRSEPARGRLRNIPGPKGLQ